MTDQSARHPKTSEERIQAFVDAYREDDDSELVAQVRAYVYLTIGDLRGILADRIRLAAQVAELEAERADTGSTHRELLASTYCALCGNRRTSPAHITGCLPVKGS